ncbi:helix-turn-helix transcriptional regulator [Kocuria palustris]|uniref:helix-turn-helix transcriptional regulator n=1 Tax=Kocuria palustris TaxID=71999 RepID=UPI002468468C|nr:helix-turn-helix domain-containing protein [Kocuria palustris]MDH5151817.1 helix-turn-helix domain-containing protein [Kocuria palustris]
MPITAPAAQAAKKEHDRLIYVEEVAQILRRTPSAVRFMVHAGTAPPSAKIGGRRMWKESEVYAWLDEQFEQQA